MMKEHAKQVPRNFMGQQNNKQNVLNVFKKTVGLTQNYGTVSVFKGKDQTLRPKKCQCQHQKSKPYVNFFYKKVITK